LHESCLDFCHIEIFLKSLLLGMDAEFVFPLSDQPLDFIDVQMCASSHWLLSSRADVNFTRTLCGEPAKAYYRQALTLAEALGMRPLVAHCHCGLGSLYAKINQWDAARGELSAAIELYRAMEMTFWLTAAEKLLTAKGIFLEQELRHKKEVAQASWR
jgi:hypothetical protein